MALRKAYSSPSPEVTRVTLALRVIKAILVQLVLRVFKVLRAILVRRVSRASKALKVPRVILVRQVKPHTNIQKKAAILEMRVRLRVGLLK